MESLDRRDPYRARLLNNLGSFYYLVDDWAKAEKMFKQGIAFIEKELGQDRPELVPSFINLGGLYVAQKKWNDAAALFERALRLLANSVTANPPDVAAVLDNFGLLDLDRNNLIDSEKALRRAYAIRLQALGPKHPLVARTAAHLGATLTAEGEYSAAEGFYNEALTIYENVRGSDIFGVMTTLEGLAALFRKTNRQSRAEQLQARADSIRFELTHTVRADQLRK
jgi:tetratricopeptide (TPR) repeat protein